MSVNANSADGDERLMRAVVRRKSVLQPHALPSSSLTVSSVAVASMGIPAPPPDPDVGQVAADEEPPSTVRSSRDLRTQLHHFLSDQVTPIRLASHLAVLMVAALVFVFNQVEIPDWEVPLHTIGQQVPLAAQAESAVSLPSQTGIYVVGQESFTPDLSGSLQRVAAPITTLQNNSRDAIELYTVHAGDTVLGIAAKFNLNPETIQWANPELERNPDLLRIGDRLTIMPVDGVLHTILAGDTLSAIAHKYKVSMESVVDLPLNGLESINSTLIVSSKLVVPAGVKPFVAPQAVAYSGPVPTNASRGTGNFAWPVSGSISQAFWSGHRAVDIGAWLGAPIKAADSGYVVQAGGGWNGGYGNMVTIDHGKGFVTLYAHLNSFYVRQGESVTKGQQIGTVGTTGNSTGPHLHFEIRYQGVPRNPFSYLQ